MLPHGEIYIAYSSQESGEVSLRPGILTRIGYFLMRGLGVGIVGFIVITIATSFWPVISSELAYTVNQNLFDLRPQTVLQLEKMTSRTPIDVEAVEEANKVFLVQQEAKGLGVNSHFSLVVPKINAKASVMANVDTSSEKEYTQALKTGVAHAKGTFFPGQGKTIFLFSHSTNSPLNVERYSAVFYLLRKLEEKDRVVVFFADKKYEYEVVEKKVVGATDVSWMSKDFGEERLILQTCTPPGTTWQRLLIIAKPVTQSVLQ